jgi:hypothetical protein
MLKVITTNTVDPQIWDDFVEQHPSGTIYHHSSWQGVINKTYGYQPIYHILLNDNSSIHAALSSVMVKSWLTGNRIVSYPFSDTCEPLLKDSEDLEPLLEAVAKFRAEAGARYAEIRFSSKKPTSYNNNQRQPEYFNFHISLDADQDALFRSFHQSCVQRAIRKARLANLEIVSGQTEEDLKRFYRLHLMTRRRHGVPTQPYKFFRNLWHALFPKKMLTLLLAFHSGRPLSGIILLRFKDTAYYKFGASDDRFLSLRANQLLMWEAIKVAKQNGCNRFEFGRASPLNKGLSNYKERWSTNKEFLHYLRIPDGEKISLLNETSRYHIFLKNIFKRIPILMNRLTGNFLYKHFA